MEKEMGEKEVAAERRRWARKERYREREREREELLVLLLQQRFCFCSEKIGLWFCCCREKIYFFVSE
jgi:hypothetical protein